MRLARLFPERIEAERIAHTFDHGRFTGPSSAHQNVKVAVEMDGRVPEESPLPSDSQKFGMRLRLRIAVQPYAGFRIEEGLTQGLDGDIRHLDVTGCAVLFQVLRTVHVGGVNHRHGAVALMLDFLVLKDWSDIIRRI